jgi:archaemetzincin
LTPQTENNIMISPIGAVDAEMLKQISIRLKGIFGYSTDIETLLQSVSFAFDPHREQYNSTLILEHLEKLVPPGTLKIIAITHVDLFIPILTYVYGEAQLGGKACIISTHRLNEGLQSIPNPSAFRVRLMKEAVHELGHTFNLRHCAERSCIMHYCRCVEDVDAKSDQLCHYCRVLLEDEKKRILGTG